MGMFVLQRPDFQETLKGNQDAKQKRNGNQDVGFSVNICCQRGESVLRQAADLMIRVGLSQLCHF